MSVLIVDDSSACREPARELLERRGYTVVAEADCAAAALNYVDCLLPDAVLLDVHLPDGNGFELAARIRDVHPQIGVLLTSADFEHCFYAFAEAHGARGYARKDQLSRVDFEAIWPGAVRST